MKGHLGTTRLLVSRGGDPNSVDKLGRTALHWAGRNKHSEVYHYLYGITDEVDLPDIYGVTARYFFDGCQPTTSVDGVVLNGDDEKDIDTSEHGSCPHMMSSAHPKESIGNLSLHSIYVGSTPPDSPSAEWHLRPHIDTLRSPRSTDVCLSMSPAGHQDPSLNRVDAFDDMDDVDVSVTASQEEDLPSVKSHLIGLRRHSSNDTDTSENQVCSKQVGVQSQSRVPVHDGGLKTRSLQQRALHIRRLTLLLFSSHDVSCESPNNTQSNTERAETLQKLENIGDRLSVDDDDDEDEEEDDMCSCSEGSSSRSDDEESQAGFLDGASTESVGYSDCDLPASDQQTFAIMTSSSSFDSNVDTLDKTNCAVEEETAQCGDDIDNYTETKSRAWLPFVGEVKDYIKRKRHQRRGSGGGGSMDCSSSTDNNDDAAVEGSLLYALKEETDAISDGLL